MKIVIQLFSNFVIILIIFMTNYITFRCIQFFLKLFFFLIC